jgi:hypothetical protein
MDRKKHPSGGKAWWEAGKAEDELTANSRTESPITVSAHE